MASDAIITCIKPPWFDGLKQLLCTLFNPHMTFKEGRDDTIFEKFLSGLGTELASKTEVSSKIIQDQEIGDVINKFFITKDSHDNGQYSSAIQIFSVLVNNNEALYDLIQYLPEGITWINKYVHSASQNSSVSMAILTFYYNILKFPAGLDLILHQGGINFCISNLQGKCLFVRNKSKQVLHEILLTPNIQDNDNLITSILTELFENLSFRPEASLQILSKVCATSIVVCKTVKENLKGGPILMKMLKESNISFVSNQIAVLLAVLVLFQSNPNGNDIQNCLNSMMEWKRYDAVLVFSCEVMKRSSKDTGNMRYLLSPVKEYTSISTNIENHCKFHFESLTESRKLLRLAFSCLDDLCSNTNTLDSISWEHATIVLSLLDASCFENCSVVFADDRVVIGAIEFLHKFFSVTKEEINSDEVLNTWVKLINKCKNNCSLMIKVLNLLDKAVNVMIKDNKHLPNLDQVGKTLNWYLGDTRWEIQDSIIELITKLATKCGSSLFQMWLIKQNFHKIFSDLIFTFSPNSNVIASAIKALAAYMDVDQLKTAIFDDCSISSDKFFDRIVLILEQTDDYLIRRSASEILCNCPVKNINASFKDDKMLCSMTEICYRDLDWCVKINALCFWKSIFNEVFLLDEAKDFTMKVLEKNGFITSVVSTFRDHDTSVQKESAKLLRTVQYKLNINIPINSCELQSLDESKTKKLQILVTDPQIPGDDREKAINEVVETDEYCRLLKLLKSETKVDESEGQKPNMPEIQTFGVKDLVNVLEKINFHDRLEKLAKPTDTYCENFSSLIGDLLDCTRGISDEDVKDVIVDCY